MSEREPRVLVVDDEPSIRRFLRVSLVSHGYGVIEAASGQTGLDAVQASEPDIVILDLGLPDIEGDEVIRRLRRTSEIPVIILSVRDGEADKIAALDAGADDYLTKPFSLGELLARVRAALRRASPATPAESVIVCGDLRMDLAQRSVSVRGGDVQLTPTEYDLLRVLMSSAGRVMTHRRLLTLVWGGGYETQTHLLRVNVSNLRKRIELDPTQPRYVLTEPGVGYRLSDGGPDHAL
jgi:two-component system, OmpR family, KDP operon response regulator KdpE